MGGAGAGGLVLALGLGAAVAAGGASPSAPLQVDGSTREGLSLTVYSSGALVRETRRAELPRGRVRLSLDGLPETLEPSTVQAAFPGGGVRLLEQDHRRDLVSTARILELSTGRAVTLLEGSPEEGYRRIPATLLAADGGLVLATDSGVLLRADGTVEVPELPPGLLLRPALEWLLEVERPGSQELGLSYLAGGLAWSADYVASLHEDEKRLDLQAWVTVHNSTGGAFPEARLRLVGGDLPRVSGRAPDPAAMEMKMVRALEADATGSEFARQAAADYHLYTLERPATLAPRSAKQIALHQAASVPAARRYVTGGGSQFLLRHLSPGEPQELPVDVRLEFVNASKAGLGVPLPAGIVRVYGRQGGGALFLGEDRMGHTPADEKVSLAVGRAFDLVAERRQTDYQDRTGIRRGSFEAAFEVVVRNRKPKAVTVEVRETVPGDWTVVQASHPHRKLDVRTLGFDLEVPAGGETVLTYRVRVS